MASFNKLPFTPVGWVNWTGFLLFGFLSVALVAEIFSAFSEGRTSDGFAAIAVGAACGWMTFLFATTPFRDEDELAEIAAARRDGNGK